MLSNANKNGPFFATLAGQKQPIVLAGEHTSGHDTKSTVNGAAVWCVGRTCTDNFPLTAAHIFFFFSTRALTIAMRFHVVIPLPAVETAGGRSPMAVPTPPTDTIAGGRHAVIFDTSPAGEAPTALSAAIGTVTFPRVQLVGR